MKQAARVEKTARAMTPRTVGMAIAKTGSGNTDSSAKSCSRKGYCIRKSQGCALTVARIHSV